VDANILLETVEVAAIKTPAPPDGECVFAGEAVIYLGPDEEFDDGRGHVLRRDVPSFVCRKTAARLRDLGHHDLFVTEPTWHHAGGGCC
jgi:hypothetical protein